MAVAFRLLGGVSLSAGAPLGIAALSMSISVYVPQYALAGMSSRNVLLLYAVVAYGITGANLL